MRAHVNNTIDPVNEIEQDQIWRLPVWTLALPFAAAALLEILSMLILYYLPVSSSLYLVLADLGWTVLVVIPVVGFGLLWPLFRRLEGRRQFEEAQARAQERLEQLVDERTRELHLANQALLQEVVERQEMEVRLRDKRQRLELLLRQLPAVAWASDTAQNITWYGGTGLRHLSVDPADLVGKHLTDFVSLSSTHPLYLAQQKALQGRSTTFETGVGERYFQFCIEPLVDETGKVIGSIGVGHDRTEMQTAAAHLRQRNLELVHLNEIASLISGLLEQDSILETVALFFSETLKLDAGLVYLCDETCGSLCLSASWGLGEIPEGLESIPQEEYHQQGLLQEPRVTIQEPIPDTYYGLGEKAGKAGRDFSVYLSIPIQITQRMLGVIEVLHSESGSVRPAQQSFYSALGRQIGVALQNALLFEEVNQGYERVKALSHRLVSLQENERHSIARELHDETSQILASMVVGLDLLQRSAGDSVKTQAGVAELEKIVSDLMENMNRIASNLRPPVLDKLGLTASLREYARAFMERHRIEVNFETFGLPGRLPPEMEIAIFRIVQESLTNVLRHAEASQVDILLKQVDESLILLVEDNGMGFSPDLISRSRLGLVGMRERVEALGGTLVIETAPLEGVLLQAVFPLSNIAEDIT